MSSRPRTRGQVLWDALPGTTNEIVARTGLYRKGVLIQLKELIREGRVKRKTRWLGKMAHTYVYQKAKGARGP